MKIDKKKLLVNLAILLIPVLIIFLLTPLLPDQILIQKGIAGNRYIDKQYAFLLGLLPYIIYISIKTKYKK